MKVQSKTAGENSCGFLFILFYYILNTIFLIDAKGHILKLKKMTLDTLNIIYYYFN